MLIVKKSKYHNIKYEINYVILRQTDRVIIKTGVLQPHYTPPPPTAFPYLINNVQTFVSFAWILFPCQNKSWIIPTYLRLVQLTGETLAHELCFNQIQCTTDLLQLILYVEFPSFSWVNNVSLYLTKVDV